MLTCQSNHLRVLNLCQNKLTEDNSIKLLNYSLENVSIQKLLIKRNLIGAQILKDIADQCKMNILIKEKILKNLKMAIAHGVANRMHHRDSYYRDYDVSEVVLEDQKLDSVLFISKFIK